MTIDTSIYGNLPQPQSATDQLGNYVGLANELVRNRILQSELPQVQIATQQAQGRLRLGQIWNQMAQNSPNGVPNPFAYLQEVAKDPQASLVYDVAQQNMQPMFDQVAAGYTTDKNGNRVPVNYARYQYQAIEGGGQPQTAGGNPNRPNPDDYHQPEQGAIPTTVTPQGEPKPAGAGVNGDGTQPMGGGQGNMGAGGASNAPQQQPNGGGQGAILGEVQGLPVGYEHNQQDWHNQWQDVMNNATSAQTEKAALENILDLSRSGAPSGTVLGQFYTYLAQHNLAPAGAQSDAEKLQLINSHAAQISQAMAPRSDQDLVSKQLANIDAKDLPGVIQRMTPYLIGTKDMRIAQANYYRQQDPTGLNPNKISAAQNFWTNTADPRVWELQELSKNDPKGFAERLKGLDPAEAKSLAQHRRALRGLLSLGNE